MVQRAVSLPSGGFRPESHKPPSGRRKIGIIVLVAALGAGISINFLGGVWEGTTPKSNAPSAQPIPFQQEEAPAQVVEPPALLPQTAQQDHTPAAIESPSTPATVISRAASAPLVQSPLTRSSELAPSTGGITKVKDVDLSKLPEIASFAATSGGSIAAKDALYADLTHDGQDEALISVESSGTFGTLGYFVVTVESGWPLVIHRGTTSQLSQNGLRVQIEDGRLVEIAGIYGPSDPYCCPSLLERTYYAWDGQNFQLQTREILPVGVKSKFSD